MRVKIRRATIEDVSDLIEIEETSFPRQLCFDKNKFKYHIRHNLSLVIEIKEKSVGYAILSPLTRIGNRRIYSVAVHKDYRGKGLSKKLLKYLEKESEASNLILEVDETNKVAFVLYESLGYKQFGRYDKYYGETDALRMIKKVKK